MGMYTELKLYSKLRSDTPPAVIDALEIMLDREAASREMPDHPLFKTGRWRVMLRMSSAYFDTPTDSELRRVDDGYILAVQCNLKNYDGEIEKFVDWIMPWCDVPEGTVLGHSRYEECDEPTVICKKLTD